MKHFLIKNWSQIVIVLFGLVPLIWYFGKGDVLIAGVDINFPLDPLSWFLRRLYVWNPSVNAGSDFSSSTAGLFFHFIQLVPHLMGLSLTFVQITSILFWSFAIVISSYLFIRQLLPKNKVLHLLFVALYSFNIYLFNTWENIKVANLSLVATIPLTLYVFLLSYNSKISREASALISLFIGILLSGAGINPAYIISYFVLIIIFTVTHFVFSDNRKKTFLDLIAIFVPIVLVNMFWIVPTVYYILAGISSQNSLGSIGFTNWIDSLSKNTSVLNVLRLQGAWDWYALDEASGMPLYIPYAVNYFYNLPFQVFSYLLPVLAFMSLILRSRRKKYTPLYISFSLMIIVGVFMGVGTHEPTGTIFKFLISNVPFFSLFRSPWYIFTPLLTLSYSGLISLLLKSLYGYIPKKYSIGKLFVSFIAFVLIIGNFFYTYPQVTGKIFRPTRNDRFFVYFPNYIFESGKWLNSVEGRVVGYPDDELEQFEWGYRGIESILTLVSRSETIFSPLNITSEGLNKVIKEMYFGLKRNEYEKTYNLLSKLNVAYIFNKNDQSSLSPSLSQDIRNLPAKEIGKWVFYKVPDSIPGNKVKLSNEIFLSYPNDNVPGNLAVLKGYEHLAHRADTILLKNPNVAQNTKEIISTENSQEKAYQDYLSHPSDLSSRFFQKEMNEVLFTFIVNKEAEYQIILEAYKLADFGLNLGTLNATIDGNTELMELESQDRSYLYFKPRKFNPGSHYIKILLNTPNLVQGKITNNELFTSEGIGEIKIYEDNLGKYVHLHNRGQKDVSIHVPIEKFDPFKPYLINITYQHIYGRYATLLLSQKNNKSLIKTTKQEFPNHPSWNSIHFYYEPVQTRSDLEVIIDSMKSDDPLGTEINYRDLRVYPVFNNKMILKEVQNTILSEVPKIEITKKSPVKYEGRISDVTEPHFVILQENYSKDWMLKVNGKKNSDHFKVDMYANGWRVSNSDDYSFEIYYWPQNLLYIGWTISVAGIILVGVVYLLRRRRHG